MALYRLDDLDKKTPVEEPTLFSFDGTNYTIDLGDANYKKLADALAPFIAVAQETRQVFPTTQTVSQAADQAVIREWAISQGLQVAARGRISQDIRDKYNEAQAKTDTDKADDFTDTDKDSAA